MAHPKHPKITALGAVFVCLLLPGFLSAQTTLSYTGNIYPGPNSYGCSGEYACNGTTPFLTITLITSLSLTQLENFSGNLAPYVTSYRISDNYKVTITNASVSPSFYATLATNASGVPMSWTIWASAQDPPNYGTQSACSTTVGGTGITGGCGNSGSIFAGDASELDYTIACCNGGEYGAGRVTYNYPYNGHPGKWVVIPGVPVATTETIPVADTPAVAVTPSLIPLNSPVAYSSAASLGFGGQSGTLPLTVSNLGQANLMLLSATPSAPPFAVSLTACTNGASSLPTTLPPGGACIFSVSDTVPGSATGSVAFVDNAPLSNLPNAAASSNFTQSVPLNGAGTGTPAPAAPSTTVSVPVSETITTLDIPVIAVTAPLLALNDPVAEFSFGSLDFGNQACTQPLTLSNIGQANLTLSSATPSGPFTMARIACTTGGSSLPASLPPGGACVFYVTYTAPGSGTTAGTLVFADNAPLSNVANAAAGATFTQSIPLSGAGVDTAAPPPPSAAVTVSVNETIQTNDGETILIPATNRACALTNQVSVVVTDLRTILNEALGIAPAMHDLTGDGVVNIVDAQIVGNAVIGLGCWGF
jgi:hypothetical protein